MYRPRQESGRTGASIFLENSIRMAIIGKAKFSRDFTNPQITM